MKLLCLILVNLFSAIAAADNCFNLGVLSNFKDIQINYRDYFEQNQSQINLDFYCKNPEVLAKIVKGLKENKNPNPLTGNPEPPKVVAPVTTKPTEEKVTDDPLKSGTNCRATSNGTYSDAQVSSAKECLGLAEAAANSLCNQGYEAIVFSARFPDLNSPGGSGRLVCQEVLKGKPKAKNSTGVCKYMGKGEGIGKFEFPQSQKGADACASELSKEVLAGERFIDTLPEPQSGECKSEQSPDGHIVWRYSPNIKLDIGGSDKEDSFISSHAGKFPCKHQAVIPSSWTTTPGYNQGQH